MQIRAIMLAAAIAIGLSQAATAAVISRGGVIREIAEGAGGNYSFRIYLSDNSGDVLGTCTGDFAYVNVDDSNYNAKVAVMLTNFSQHRATNVSIDQDVNGYCRIAELWTFASG